MTYKKIVLLSMCLFTFITGTVNDVELYSKEYIENDIIAFLEAIDALYLPKYFDIDSAKYDSLSSILSEYSPQSHTSEIELFTLLSTYLNEFHNGHANVNYPSIIFNKRVKYFPLNLLPYDSTLAVIGTPRRSTVPSGSQIVSIDSMSVEDIYSMAQENGFGETAEFRTLMGVLHFHIHNFLYDVEKETYEVAFIPPHSDSIHHTTVNAQREKRRGKKGWYNFENNLSWYVNKEDGFGLFEIANFRKGSSLYSELDTFLANLETESCSTIVFDLRDNLGGELTVVLPLLYALNRAPEVDCLIKKPITSPFLEFVAKYNINVTDNTNRWYAQAEVGDTLTIPLNAPYRDMYSNSSLLDKDIYVLVNRNSYSASIIFASLLQKNGFATIIGENTSQPIPAHATPVTVTLPNSQLTVRIPIASVTSSVSNDAVPTFLIPDISVRETYEDYMNKHDPMLEKVRELLENN